MTVVAALRAISRELVISVVLAGAARAEGAQEIGRNAGAFVERVQRRTGNKPPDAWCVSWAYDVGEGMCAALGLRWPLPRTASCDALLQFARRMRILHETPEPGDLFLVMGAPDDAIHGAWVTKTHGPRGRDGFDTLEGNTNAHGGREGYCVAARQRGRANDAARYEFVRWIDLLFPPAVPPAGPVPPTR